MVNDMEITSANNRATTQEGAIANWALDHDRPTFRGNEVITAFTYFRSSAAEADTVAILAEKLLNTYEAEQGNPNRFLRPAILYLANPETRAHGLLSPENQSKFMVVAALM